MNHFRHNLSKCLLKTWSGKYKSYISTMLLKLPQGLSNYPSIFHGNWGWKRALRCLAHIPANTKLLHAVLPEVCPVFNRVKKLPPFLPMEKLFSTIKDFTAKKQFLTLSLKYSPCWHFYIHLYFIHTYIYIHMLYNKSQTAPTYIIQALKSQSHCLGVRLERICSQALFFGIS